MKDWQEAVFVLHQIWARPITTKSDKAREWADAILWATARGYLTTEVAPWTREYGNMIKATPKGLLFIEEVLSGVAREDILEILSGKFEPDDEEVGQLEGPFRFD